MGATKGFVSGHARPFFSKQRLRRASAAVLVSSGTRIVEPNLVLQVGWRHEFLVEWRIRKRDSDSFVSADARALNRPAPRWRRVSESTPQGADLSACPRRLWRFSKNLTFEITIWRQHYRIALCPRTRI